MVPPWNRIDAALAERLPGLGFAALSTYQARTTATAAPGLVQTNCHLDILRWKPERRFIGTEASLGLLPVHLAANSRGPADANAPSGTLLTHRETGRALWKAKRVHPVESSGVSVYI